MRLPGRRSCRPDQNVFAWRCDRAGWHDRRVAAEFSPGTGLAARLYQQVVRPLLDERVPGVRHSAALIGRGSEVLGFDTPRSVDHNWGPRCQVFLGPADADQVARITALLADHLPATFEGWPVWFSDVTAPDPAPRHWVEVAELGSWLTRRLGFDPRAGVALKDWLTTPTQILAEITGGAVFSDGLAGFSGGRGSGLHAARAALAWYPDDVWRYVLACQWTRISQEEAFPGRCAEVGDDLGSAIVAARLSRDLVRLTLLMHRTYPPYSKWLGSAFARLPAVDDVLRPALTRAVTAASWPERERSLCAAYEAVAALHNDLGLTAPVDGSVRPYFDRPFQVIDAGRFAAALLDAIADDQIRQLPPTGAVDQFVDSTDALGDQPLLRSAISARFRQLSTGSWLSWRTHDRFGNACAMNSDLPENLDRLAQIQHGVLSAHQAISGGMSRDQIRTPVRTGRWRPLHYGVYATFTGVPSREALLWAAVLRAGSGALLSYETAAELQKLADWASSQIHVTIPGRRRIAAISGAVVHHAVRAEQAAHPTNLPPRTRIEETVLDLAQAAATVEQACGWITRGIGRRLTTQQKLRRAFERRQRIRFRAEITELLSEEMAGVHSALEYRYVKWVELPHGLPRGRRQAPESSDGRRVYRDVLYDGYNLIVELDGRAAHPGDTRWNDIRRDNAAAASGRMTLRYGWYDLQAPCLVADEVYRALRLAGPVSAKPCSPQCPVTRTSS